MLVLAITRQRGIKTLFQLFINTLGVKTAELRKLRKIQLQLTF